MNQIETLTQLCTLPGVTGFEQQAAAAVAELLRPEDFIGRAPRQVEEFLDGVVRPVLAANRALLGERAELSV